MKSLALREFAVVVVVSFRADVLVYRVKRGLANLRPELTFGSFFRPAQLVACEAAVSAVRVNATSFGSREIRRST